MASNQFLMKKAFSLDQFREDMELVMKGWLDAEITF